MQKCVCPKNSINYRICQLRWKRCPSEGDLNDTTHSSTTHQRLAILFSSIQFPFSSECLFIIAAMAAKLELLARTAAAALALVLCIFVSVSSGLRTPQLDNAKQCRVQMFSPTQPNPSKPCSQKEG